MLEDVVLTCACIMRTINTFVIQKKFLLNCPKINFVDLIFTNQMIPPFCTVLSRILIVQI